MSKREERQWIQDLVRDAGTVRDAATRLGVTRQALYQRIERLGGTVLTTSEVVFPADDADDSAAPTPAGVAA